MAANRSNLPLRLQQILSGGRSVSPVLKLESEPVKDRDEEVAALPLEGGTFMRFSFVAFDKDEGRRHLRPSAKNVEEAESPPGC
ncbi:hypothetical protein BHE74_00000379 [Ensete ventricosum]|uniref:Uncharacterized protein n=1 Tax=Ensete ventricosum TaxID=4639 RepID=A0A427B768_ENSVE|nr:hypothetical protein B296_00001841 [Ensete ventricosum]RWW90543.1 hypothetical protein BHE74_00000379 [Ensete ventricosum]